MRTRSNHSEMNRIIRTVTAILLCGMLCCPVVEAQGRRPGRTEHNTVNNNHGGRPGGSSNSSSSSVSFKKFINLLNPFAILILISLIYQ